ncbi:Cadmium, cobalt and zinc/H(+)-K(+) antiporter [Commensalibacter sp. Nvir]|uniref:cation diffusion facilitator family transporter n=1 Tax=Commensalibacter sp. Nvir TaxID=3069817 RepID=UPI002D27E4B0|nr:Cadmium, cobalt and zinc/H(+)-K(+) antiporter [Commensalibacter sp. Nvir]
MASHCDFHSKHKIGHNHDHSHGHNHSHHHTPKSFGRAFAFGITLNLLYVVIEALWGLYANSLALLADAGHNLSDILALACAWVAMYLSKKQPTQKFTYGYRRTSILASLSNAIILLIVTGGIIWEAIERIIYPTSVGGWAIIIVAAVGVVVNGLTALLFASGQKDDLNIKGAFLHMAYDALLSFAVIISGIIIVFTHLNIVDPIISLLVSVFIIWGTWSLLKNSVTLAVDGVPVDMDTKAIEHYLRSLPGIVDLHDLHIWAMSTTETALTVHLVSDSSQHSEDFLANLSQNLMTKFKIHHATFQIERVKEAKKCLLAHAGTV